MRRGLLFVLLILSIFLLTTLTLSFENKSESLLYSVSDVTKDSLKDNKIMTMESNNNYYIIENITTQGWAPRKPINVTKNLSEFGVMSIDLYDIDSSYSNPYIIYIAVANSTFFNDTEGTLYKRIRVHVFEVDYTPIIDNDTAKPREINLLFTIDEVFLANETPRIRNLCILTLENGSIILYYDLSKLYANESLLWNSTAKIYTWDFTNGLKLVFNKGFFLGYYIKAKGSKSGNVYYISYALAKYSWSNLINGYELYYEVGFMNASAIINTVFGRFLEPLDVGNVYISDDILTSYILRYPYEDKVLVAIAEKNETDQLQMYYVMVDTFLEAYLGYRPQLKYPAVAKLDIENQTWVFYVVFHDVEQYLFVQRVDYSNASDIKSLEYIVLPLTLPTKLEIVDYNNTDNSTVLLLIDSSFAVSSIMEIMFYLENNQTKTTNLFFYISLAQGNVMTFEAAMNENEDIFLMYTNKTVEKEHLLSIAFRDTDMDALGDWEEDNYYFLNKTNPDFDGDGINDGTEVFRYRTKPDDNDTDDDGLDDRFELEIRANETYPEYGGITNNYRTDPLNSDTDNDNITDYEEVTGNYLAPYKSYKTDPTSEDTDGDGLTDWQEIFSGIEFWVENENNKLRAYTNPLLEDSDDDNLTDDYERDLMTNPTSNDTDGDGLTDWQEDSVYYTDPHVLDSDGDGLTDGEEIYFGTNPLSYDTDGDTLNDSYEIKEGLNPLSDDTDDDGILEWEELAYGTDPKLNDTDGDNLTDYEELVILNTDATSNDTDGDGLTDWQEVKVYHTDPNDSDTDNDGIDDKDELNLKLNPLSDDTDNDGLLDSDEIFVYNTDPLKNDTDGDGLTDYEEIIVVGSDALDKDTDRDGLTDYEEVKVRNTNPTAFDTDGDDLSDYEEIFIYHTDPNSPDTDEDGLKDGYEISLDLNPNEKDTDGDSLNDGFEVFNGLNAGKKDTDDDGLNDGLEVNKYKTNPRDSDSDDDGLLDGYEVSQNLDPLDPDTDDDGLNDGLEVNVYKTNPKAIDSDGDGLSDSNEVLRGTNPTSTDTDGDFMPDNIDPLPLTSNFIFIAIIILLVFGFTAYQYGVFRNVEKDIIGLGISDLGGLILFTLPDEFRPSMDPTIISNGLLGISTMIGEITGKETRKLVLSGELPIVIIKGNSSYLWAFVKKAYPKLIKRLSKALENLEEKYGKEIEMWAGIAIDTGEMREFFRKNIKLE